MNPVVSFVPYTRDFLAKSWDWLNDAEIKSLTLTPDFTKEQQEKFYNGLPARKDYMIWGISLNGLPIGACGLKHITVKGAEYWGYIGEKQYWGKGLGSQIISHCERMAQARRLTELYLHVGKNNVRARRLYEKCNFTLDGAPNGDVIVMKKVI